MKEEWFAQLLSDDVNMSAEFYDSLTAALCKYPYFQILLINKLRFVKKELSEQYPNLLKRYTVSIHNHKHYLLFLNRMTRLADCNVVNGNVLSSTKANGVDELFSVVPDCSATVKKTEEAITPNVAKEDIMAIIEQTDSPEVVDNIGNENILDRNDLIDRFMRDLPSMPKLRPDNDNISVFENKEVDSEDELFSETLAKIYVKQGLYDKAITTYIKLSLKFPEKSVYFANRIEVIKEKINN